MIFLNNIFQSYISICKSQLRPNPPQSVQHGSQKCGWRLCGLNLVLYKTNGTKRIQESKVQQNNFIFGKWMFWWKQNMVGSNNWRAQSTQSQQIYKAENYKKQLENLSRRKGHSTDDKYAVPKRDIYYVLSEAHSATAHRGRDKTERYIRASHAGISQDVISLFVSLCKLHQQQKSVTDHCKKVITKPIKANQLISLTFAI